MPGSTHALSSHSPPAAEAAARRGFWWRYRRNRPALGGLLLLCAIGTIAAAAPLLAPFGPWDMAGAPFLWPGEDPAHRLGTDVLGRDIFSGLAHGARVSLSIGLAATCAAVVIGTGMGALAGYLGGWMDAILMRITEVFQTIPPFLFVIVLVAVFRPSIATVILAIAVVSWPAVARLVRGEALRLRRTEFVQSCIVIGMTDRRIILTQVLPNCLAPIIVIASVMVATAVLTEAGLAFLGLSDPNVMSWGTMISIGREALRSAWYMVALPGVAILVTVLSLNLIGDGLNDALNPRLGAD